MAFARKLEFDLTIAKLSRRTHVAAVTGELDLRREDELRRRLRPIANRQDTRLIVDLSDVPFVDTTALSVLAGVGTRLRQLGGELVVASDDPRLLRLLELTGLSSAIAVESSLARAVERDGSGHSD